MNYLCSTKRGNDINTREMMIILLTFKLLATDVPEGHLRCIENGKLIRFDSGKIVADADCSNATWFIFEST